MKLNAYLRLNNITDGEFAVKVRRDRTTVSRWRRGTTRPEWEDVESIVKATDGAVRPNDFLPSEPEAAE
jgi:hypothetical protein